MSNSDPFFSLPGTSSRLDSDGFYQHMDRSNHLCDSIYEPAILDRRDNRVTRMVGKTFERVSFSKTEIKNIIFTDCTFNDCRFIGTKVIDCEFHHCAFDQTNTYKIAFSNTYIDPLSFRSCLDKTKYQNIGVQLYQNLMNNSRDMEQPEFEADAHFLFLRWKRYQESYEAQKAWKKSRKPLAKKRARILARFLWEWLFGSGIRIRHYLVTVFGCVILVSTLNYLFRDALGLAEGGVIITSAVDSIYFSTVTLTTLGFGDITPASQLGRLIIAGQGVLGFFLFATLASMLFRKIMP